MTTWGATNGHLRVGVDVSMSPSKVTEATTSVTLTWKVTVQTVSWWFAEGQTATLSGAVSASKAYRKDDPKTTGTYDTVVGSWTSTVATSASAPIARQLNVAISTNASGARPTVAASFTVPQRPAAPKPPVVTPPPTDSTPPPEVTTPEPVVAGDEYQVIQVPDATVRSLASATSTHVADLATGSRVKGVMQDGWLKISEGQYVGLYVKQAALKLVADLSDLGTTPETPANPPPTDGTADVPLPGEGVASRVDLVPAVASLVWASGDYDAFPQTAAHGETVMTAWRHAIAHDVDRNASVMAALSTDGGRTYGTPWVIPTPKVANAEPGPAGLAWDAKGSQWVMLLTWRQYADATTKSVSVRWTEVLTSKDDGQTWSAPKRVDMPGTGWFFCNDLAIRGDLWIIAGYGSMTGVSGWQAITTTSRDAGATWSAPARVQGTPDGSGWAEPNVTPLAGGSWLMTLRSVDAVEIHRAVSTDGVSWSYAGLAVAGYTGNPDIIATADGALLMLARTPNTPSSSGPGYNLGFWAWGSSLDNGATWAMNDGVGGVVGRNVYGSMALTPSGVALVLAAEDDPDAAWQSASVYSSRFVTQQLLVNQGFVGSVAVVDVTTADRIPVRRVWTDPWTGEELSDRVRWRTLDGFTSRDFEVQQGQVVTYKAGARVTGQIVGDILPHIILVHPLRPDLSVPIEVATDSARTFKLDSQVTEIPGSPYAIVTKSGARKVRSPYGETKFRTRTLEDADRVLRLFEDGCPLFVSHHPGADFPDWIQPLEDLEVDRVVQMCGHPDHGTDLGEWRDWSFKWVAVRRPSAAALPVRRRIQEIDQTIQSLNLPIQET